MQKIVITEKYMVSMLNILIKKIINQNKKVPVWAVIIILLFSCNASANIKSELPDSIKVQLKSSSNNERINAYINAITFYNRTIPQKALEYEEISLSEARKNKNRKAEAELLFLLGISYHAQSNYNKSLEYYNKAYEINKEIKNNVGIGECLNRIGMIYNVKGDFEVALDYCLRAVKILENEKDNKALGHAYNQLGILYYILNDIPKAKDILFKSLEFSESANEGRVMAVTHEHLGVIFIKTEEFDKALYHVKKSLELRELNNDRLGIAGSYENLAIIYRNLKKYDEALKYYFMSLGIKKEINNKRGMASSYSGIGVTYFKMGRIEEGLDFIKRAYELRKEIGDKRGMVASLTQLADNYSAINDYENAFTYHKLAKLYSDSLLNEQKNKAVAEFQEKFQREKREKEILQLQQENTIHRSILTYLIIIIVLLAVIAVVIFFAYRSKRKTNALLISYNKEVTNQKEELIRLNTQLHELIATKDKFFSIIAHDLRSPFQGFLGLAQIITEQAGKITAEELSSLGSNLYKTADNLFTLLKNLLEWAQMQRGVLNYEPALIVIKDLIDVSVEAVKRRIEQKDITVDTSGVKPLSVYADSKMVNSVLLNLISNSVKFTGMNGAITIKTDEVDNMIQISVADTGVGIAPDRLEKLFLVGEKIGTKGTEGELSTGLGLILCKEFIDLHGGKIWVHSTVGKGSIFYFTLPAVKN